MPSTLKDGLDYPLYVYAAGKRMILKACAEADKQLQTITVF